MSTVAHCVLKFQAEKRIIIIIRWTEQNRTEYLFTPLYAEYNIISLQKFIKFQSPFPFGEAG